MLLFGAGLLFLIGIPGQGLLISVLTRDQVVATQAGALSTVRDRRLVASPSTSKPAIFLAAVRGCAPQATLNFDRFHVQKLANAARDEVRRAEMREADDEAASFIKKSRWALLKNPWNLSRKQGQKLREIHDEAVREAGLDVGEDSICMLGNCASELHERHQPR